MWWEFRLPFVSILEVLLNDVRRKEKHRWNRLYHCSFWGYRIFWSQWQLRPLQSCSGRTNLLQWALEKAPSNSAVSTGSAKLLAILQSESWVCSSPFSFFSFPYLISSSPSPVFSLPYSKRRKRKKKRFNQDCISVITPWNNNEEKGSWKQYLKYPAVIWFLQFLRG